MTGPPRRDIYSRINSSSAPDLLTAAGSGGLPEPPDARLRRLAPFLFLPLAFVVTALWFARIAGPYYHAYTYDPDYVYLFNGLNVAILQSPEHTDHPGTPLQLLLGLGIRLANPGREAPDTAARVIVHAESYLSAASLLIVMAYAAVLVWAGAGVAKRSGSRVAGWLVQATPFLLGDNFLLLLRVNPEPLLLLVSLALAPWLLDLGSGSTSWSRRLLLSFLMATGLCLKVTFLPVFIIVLLVERGAKNRLWLIGLVLIWSLLWTIPIWAKYERMLGWFWGLASKQGQYGRGPAGVIRPGSFLSGLAALIWANKIYSLCLLISLGALMRMRLKGAWSMPHRRLLMCLAIGGLLQLLISVKNPQSRYLAPILGLMGLNWAVLALLAGRANWRIAPARRRLAVVSVAGLAVLAGVIQLTGLHQRTIHNTRGRAAMSRITGEQWEGARIFYYGASSLVHALTFGTFFAGQQYYRIVEQLVRTGTCESYLYNNTTGDFYSLRGQIPISRILAAGGPVFLQGDVLSEPEQRLLPEEVEIRVVEQFEDERIYEIRLKTPNEAASGR